MTARAASQPPAQARMRLRPHATVATLRSADRARLVAGLAALPAETDLAEVRLDTLWPKVPDADRGTDDLLALTDAAHDLRVPLLATLRPRRQGGDYDGPEDVRLGLLQAALRAGFAAADLELEEPGLAERVRLLRADGAVVLSLHLPGEAPCRSDGLRPLLAMQDLSPAYDKLAFEAGAFPDLLRALELARAHHLRGGRPSVSTMAHGGAATRALLALAGNRATYGHAPGLAPAVPGQPALADIEDVWRRWGLTRADLDQAASGPGQWLAVLGTPVAHSRSPRLHNAWLRADGRPERFGALDVPASASALRLVFHAAERIGLVGASVTAPHKLDAARIAQGDEAVRAVGAANCVKLGPGGKATATNTDATAVARLAGPHVRKDTTVLVLGAGGFARAATHALKGLGAHVTVATRDEAKTPAFHALGATTIPWADRGRVAPDAIVQATPLTDATVLPPAALARRPWVLESVYADGPTTLQRDAAAAGCPVVDGLRLLEEQARDAYAFWFGHPPPKGAA